MNTASFWQKNQVIITAIASAIFLVVSQYAMQDQVDWKSLGLAVAVAVAGVFGNEFRGKGMSIAGFLGAISLAFDQVYKTGTITTDKLIIAAVLAVIGLALPPFKSIGYEKTDIIKQAKKEGEVDVPTPLSPKPDKIVN